MKRAMGRVCALLLAAACLGMGAAAQTANAPAKAPTIDQSLEMKSAFSPKLSPDGKHVIYEVTRTNWEENAFETDLWIADTATGETHQLTTAKKSSTNAAWSRDGKWIAFISDRPAQLSGSPDGKRQIYVMAADGGEARQITKG
jgi:Tol biopolymer transport system component